MLLITSDQHRGDCLDFGRRADGTRLHVQTPHLRRLAAEGVYFPNCFAEGPLCVPARATLQTGQLPFRSGILGNGDVLADGVPTLAGALTAAGYATRAVGKMHFKPLRARHGFERVLLSEALPNSLEEDDFLRFLVDAGYGGVEEPNGIFHELYMQPQVSQLPETHHSTAWTGRTTIELLREHAAPGGGGAGEGAPFFFWTSFMKPHPPFEPPVPWSRLYRPGMAPRLALSEAELAWVPRGGRSPELVKEQQPDRARLDALWIYYFSAISFIDSWVGMILDELERLALRENTLVIYTSDHGELLGDHWLVGKSSFYDGSARVPFVASWPGGLSNGVVRRQLTGLADVVPTVLEATGSAPEAAGLTVDGTSLLGPARDDASTRPVVVGQVGAGARAQLAALDAEHAYVYLPGEQRELLLLRAGEGAELHNLLVGRDGEAVAKAASLRGEAQRQLRRVGATELLDGDEQDGFRRFPVTAGGASERNPWLRDRYYARWIQHLPDGWAAPVAPPDGGIAAELPRRSDRSRYDWPAMAL